MSRRTTGARSSRAASTIFKRLRNLDRQIGKLDRDIEFNSLFAKTPSNERKMLAMIKKRDKLDQKRKEVRLKRKGVL